MNSRGEYGNRMTGASLSFLFIYVVNEYRLSNNMHEMAKGDRKMKSCTYTDIGT